MVDLTPLVSELGDDVVVVDPDRMAGYRWDRANDPDAGVPAAVVRAGATEDVQAAVRFAAEHGLAVVPRGAGSGLSGGSSAVDGCLVVSTERMTHVEVDPVTRRLGALGFAEVPAVAFVWTLLAALGIAGLAWRGVGAQRASARLVVLLGFTAVPHLLAVYHGDALELGRHSLGVAAQFRVVTWLATAVLIEVALARRGQSVGAMPTGHEAPVPPKPQ